MEMDGAGGTTVIIRRDTDLQQPTRSNQYFEEEKTLQMISEQKKMDKLITTVFGIAATVGIAIFAVPPGSNTPLVNRLLVISTLISITISMAATVMVVVLLDTLACRWLRRVLVFTSCGSLWLVATLFLVGLNRSLVVAIPVALVVFFAAGRWPFSCLFSSSARREAGGLTTTIVHHGKKHTIKDVIFKKISKIFISTGFVGVFFGTNFTDYMAKASIVPGDVIYIWISIYLDFTIGLFLTASIATGLDALTDDYATTLYYIAAALLTRCQTYLVLTSCLALGTMEELHSKELKLPWHLQVPVPRRWRKRLLSIPTALPLKPQDQVTPTSVNPKVVVQNVNVREMKDDNDYFDFHWLLRNPRVEKFSVSIICEGATLEEVETAEAAARCAVDDHPNSPTPDMMRYDEDKMVLSDQHQEVNSLCDLYWIKRVNPPLLHLLQVIMKLVDSVTKFLVSNLIPYY
uniref:Uncharacterized protein n=1 Tax=Oryza punctata TaxID=4537 RepID=A0A0E0LRR2_ORYPU